MDSRKKIILIKLIKFDIFKQNTTKYKLGIDIAYYMIMKGALIYFVVQILTK